MIKERYKINKYKNLDMEIKKCGILKLPTTSNSWRLEYVQERDR